MGGGFGGNEKGGKGRSYICRETANDVSKHVFINQHNYEFEFTIMPQSGRRRRFVGGRSQSASSASPSRHFSNFIPAQSIDIVIP